MVVVENVGSVESDFGDVGDRRVVGHDGERVKREESIVVVGLGELD